MDVSALQTILSHEDSSLATSKIIAFFEASFASKATFSAEPVLNSCFTLMISSLIGAPPIFISLNDTHYQNFFLSHL